MGVWPDPWGPWFLGTLIPRDPPVPGTPSYHEDMVWSLGTLPDPGDTPIPGTLSYHGGLARSPSTLIPRDFPIPGALSYHEGLDRSVGTLIPGDSAWSLGTLRFQVHRPTTGVWPDPWDPIWPWGPWSPGTLRFQGHCPTTRVWPDPWGPWSLGTLPDIWDPDP